MEINRAHGAVHLYNLNNSAHQQPPRQLFTGHAQVLALDIDDVPLSRLQPDRIGLANETAHPVVGIRSNARSLAADRKSTRLNSSHLVSSYAVFCLKKKRQGTPKATPTTPRMAPGNPC